MTSWTPPDIKWLLNERAALAGEHERATAKREALMAKREKLEKQLSKVQKQIDATDVAARRAQASMDVSAPIEYWPPVPIEVCPGANAGSLNANCG